MLKRIVSFACIFTVMLCIIGINVPAYAANGVDISASPMSGAFDASKWTPSSSIVGGKFMITGDNVNEISMVDRYNLGNKWEASIKIDLSVSNNANGEKIVLKVGELEAVLRNVTYDKETGKLKNFAGVSLCQNGKTIGYYSFTSNYGTPNGYDPIDGLLILKYDNGYASLEFGFSKYSESAKERASGSVSGLDFSNTSISVSMDGNWVTNYITEFSLSSSVSTVKVNSNPNINGFKASDWTGDTDHIVKQADGKIAFTVGKSVRQNIQIISKDNYNLGNKWSVAVNIRPAEKSQKGMNEFINVAVGPIMAIFENSSEQYPAQIILGRGVPTSYYAPEGFRYKLDESIGSDCESNMNGELMMCYDNGVFTVYYRGKQYIKKEMQGYDFSNVKITVTTIGLGYGIPAADSFRLKKGTLSHTPYVPYKPEESKPMTSSKPSAAPPSSSTSAGSKPSASSKPYADMSVPPESSIVSYIYSSEQYDDTSESVPKETSFVTVLIPVICCAIAAGIVIAIIVDIVIKKRKKN